MKNKIALAALILVASFALAACGRNNVSDNNSAPTQATAEPSSTNTLDNSEITSSSSSSEIINSNSSAAGGNTDIATYIEVTVAEDKYFYENHEITYDDLVKVFDDLDGNTVVKISDENATLKAYESLTKALEECEILFEAA